MGSWVASLRKLSPGAKVSLFLGIGPAVTFLVEQMTRNFDRTLFLVPPIGPDDLSTTVGLPSESQATVVGPVDAMTESEWDLVASYLVPAKSPGTTLILTGEELPDYASAQKVKEMCGRGKNVYAQAMSPSGAKGRDELIGWVAESWKVYPQDADYACSRADFDLAAIVWATKTFWALTEGKSVTGPIARRLIDVAVPPSPLADAYTMIISRSADAPKVVRGLTPTQTITLFKWLERALSDLEACRAYVQRREPLGKVAKLSGVHIARVRELSKLLPLYTTDTESRCREALALGFEHWTEPEAAETVAMMWR